MTKETFSEESFEKEIYRIKSSGMVFYEDMIKGIDKAFVLCQTRPSVRILDDSRGSVPRFSIIEIKRIVSYMKENLPSGCRIRHAVIHSDPMATAYTLMVMRMMAATSYQVEVFSTEESAITWLKES